MFECEAGQCIYYVVVLGVCAGLACYGPWFTNLVRIDSSCN